METPTATQTARVVQEMACLKAGQAEATNERFESEEIRAFAGEHAKCSLSELYSRWQSWVGEWLASRSEIDGDVPTEDWIAKQFLAVLLGEERPYGFGHSVIVSEDLIKDLRGDDA
ncbi:hypothetical protein [Halorhabdus rudnickae]|uniref:hypothetical protein n=1 Tax=Halorhabdus rudnickae TaxID=1775544 RepID=UPI001083FD40|nr:hypothetical protein [Halorhabdus rudnickae]